jgi:competence protein ComEC
LHEYLVPTLAATLVTAPLILWHFGRVAWISPLVNILVLPAIPLLMGMTALVVILGCISPTIGVVLAWLLYVPLWWVVAVIRWWG